MEEVPLEKDLEVTSRAVDLNARLGPQLRLVQRALGSAMVVMNLCLNARDVMPDGDRLTIETMRWCSTGPSSLSSPGRFVEFTLSEPGRTPEVLERVSED